ncbi:CBS domain-containing protein [Colwelliaceae bacterium 6471]
MSVGSVCNRVVVYIDKHESIRAAARLMQQSCVGDVVVAERVNGLNTPIAILTDRDLVLEVIAEALDPDYLKVKDVISDFFIYVYEDEGINEVLDRMEKHGVCRAAVTNKMGELVGIFTVDNLIASMAEQLGYAVPMMQRYQGQTEATRY